MEVLDSVVAEAVFLDAQHALEAEADLLHCACAENAPTTRKERTKTICFMVLEF
jgi:hypothetical protein